ncbi:hypothetical protein [uncultured Jannaschia sp.]|uniref:hypothetical protein n=1 Tax=uncultured Jannaschia sp. TaxID=293347 RepID=UPI002634EFF7|nr:hypothetical protein [uncultured Jannaschia sp.]
MLHRSPSAQGRDFRRDGEYLGRRRADDPILPGSDQQRLAILLLVDGIVPSPRSTFRPISIGAEDVLHVPLETGRRVRVDLWGHDRRVAR